MSATAYNRASAVAAIAQAASRGAVARLGAWIEAEQGRFAPWLAVAMAGGALLYFALTIEPPAWWPAAALAAGVVLIAAAWRHAVIRAAGLSILAAALGFGAALLAADRAAPWDTLPTRAVLLQATVLAVEPLDGTRRLLLRAVQLPEGTQPVRKLRVRLKPGDDTAIQAGDRIEVRALVRPPGGPAYPGAWDQQREAWFAGLAGSGSALAPVRVIVHAPPDGIAAHIQGLRDTIATRAIAALPAPEGAIAATLLSGSARAIPEADRAAFRDSGLAHLLAVAGLHIGIVMGLVMFATRLALAAWPHAALHWPTRSIAATAALLAGLIYLLLTGAHVPILRSFVMAALVVLAVVTGRRALSMRGLALAAAALVLIAPQEVVGVSFQMSFAAVAALIAGYEVMRPFLARLHGPGWRRIALHAAMLALTSLLAGTASAPYGAYHFGHVQLYYVIANLVAVPLAAFWIMPFGMFALVLMPLGLARLALTPMGWGIDAVLWVAHGVASWPAATLPAPPLPGWGLGVFSLGLAWLCLWRTRVRLAGLAVMAAGLFSPLAVPAPDLLVSSDARLIAWRGDAGYALLAAPGASWFVRDAWRAHLGVDVWRPLGPGCDDDTCRMGGALLLRNRDARPDCTGVQLVISPEPARGVCPQAILLDRFTVWRDGSHAVWLNDFAHAVWLNNGAHAAWPNDGVATVLSDRADRGTRPWVPPPPSPRRRPSTLPMAPAEALPAATED